MLGTVREYALERLHERGEAPQPHRRHAEHFRDVAGRAAAELRAGRPSAEVYARLESELDNIRAALRWANSAEPEPCSSSRVCSSCSGGNGAISTKADGAWRVRSPTAALQRHWGGRGHSRPPGRSPQRRGDYASAKDLWQEGLDIWRGLGDAEGVARALGDLASVLDLEGDARRAIPLYEESAALLRGLGLEYELGTVVSNLGVCMTSQGRLDEAARLHEEAVGLCRKTGRDEQLVISLFNLGRVSMLQGRHRAAAKRFEEALEAARELGYSEMIAYCLKGIGEVLAARGEAESATRLLGASDRLFNDLGAHVEATEQATYEHTVEQLKDMLGDDAYGTAHAEGQALRLEQSLDLALAASASDPS
jgi:tetratricopeptide (TPR) repeat protein